MKHIVAIVLAIACVLCFVNQLECARILGVVPTPSYSHQIPYRPLWLELNKRGHEVVLITTNPIPNLNLPNFTQIDVGQSYKSLRQIAFVRQRFEGISWLNFCETNLWFLCEHFVEHVFNHTEVMKMYAPGSDTKFDVVISEVLYMPAVCSLAHVFNAPLIGLTSLGVVSFNEYELGGIVLPSHEYTWEMEANTGSNLPFWKRLTNYITLWHHLYHIYNFAVPRQQKIAEKYFGADFPPVVDVMKNMSLLFVNQANILTPARPKLANIITFTSSHISQNPAPLSKDLKRFLDDASEGFIYFSLGSNAMSSHIPKDTLQIFLDVFAKLPYRIVWKFEEELPGKPDNVFISRWFPQQSILAHPNIKLFIYQGGVQSSEEAIHFTVPVLGLAVLADQDYQVRRMEERGVGICLEILTLTRDELDSNIRELITNKKYKDNMFKLNQIINDNPYNMIDNLVWWTEYVIRHKGAPHLRSNLAWQPWYQRLDMDIVVFLTTVTCIAGFAALSVTIKVILYFRKQMLEYKKQKIS